MESVRGGVSKRWSQKRVESVRGGVNIWCKRMRPCLNSRMGEEARFILFHCTYEAILKINAQFNVKKLVHSLY